MYEDKDGKIARADIISDQTACLYIFDIALCIASIPSVAVDVARINTAHARYMDAERIKEEPDDA